MFLFKFIDLSISLKGIILQNYTCLFFTFSYMINDLKLKKSLQNLDRRKLHFFNYESLVKVSLSSSQVIKEMCPFGWHFLFHFSKKEMLLIAGMSSLLYLVNLSKGVGWVKIWYKKCLCLWNALGFVLGKFCCLFLFSFFFLSFFFFFLIFRFLYEKGVLNIFGLYSLNWWPYLFRLWNLLLWDLIEDQTCNFFNQYFSYNWSYTLVRSNMESYH